MFILIYPFNLLWRAMFIYILYKILKSQGFWALLHNVVKCISHSLSQIKEAMTAQEANSAIAEAADSLSIIGALRHVSSLEEKDSLVQSAADFFVNGRMQTALDQ